jgi:hypothetical protein
MAKKQESNRVHALVLAASTTALLLSFWMFVRSTVDASPNPNPGTANASECDTSGKQVVNVTEKIVQTVDSGEGGNYWAFDNLNRHIQVWQVNDSTYCALVQNEGTFDSQAGQKSPGNTGTLTGKEDGNFKGGYRATITGVFKDNPSWKTNGSVGTHDYQCNIAGSCGNYVSWVDQYFGPGAQFSYEWWGWTYRYKNNTWVNASDGNSGDIL